MKNVSYFDTGLEFIYAKQRAGESSRLVMRFCDRENKVINVPQ